MGKEKGLVSFSMGANQPRHSPIQTPTILYPVLKPEKAASLEWNIEVTEETWSGLIRCSPLPTEGASLSIGLPSPDPIDLEATPAIMHSSAVHLQLWSSFSRKIYCLCVFLARCVHAQEIPDCEKLSNGCMILLVNLKSS
ncbi:hypothetical protein CEXT_373031 [Caerostris extrusa]|uniref:Uncharacterized protein n=1 Tax=Caerostris extrusa TaxID=172846 RepID=A0AAV4UBN8_CAEEX|nr:hypothetical protein CEXT_373031 [Caerostris extrusa]